MTKKLLYKAGYHVFVDSWENDLDAQASTVVEARSLIEANYLYDVAMLFKDSSFDFANNYHRKTVAAQWEEECLKLMEKYPTLFNGQTLDDYDGNFSDLVMDTVDYLGLSCETYFGRVCETVEIWYFEEDVYKEIIK